ncbi:NAD(P)-dependent alcohol dehydrogenase [Pseudarthrobacter sulfonivorans]|uniref:zinc-dependent alcohol dehydrogenase family protein n=1 Tax=Pseudarthrobacter sulfonivorans TaxID=121292 RepID=UPI00168AEF28|nr:NAD(P)-dependent alcohol dehydrogenase [Pseudarthrobacter sulfonivorans]
MKAVKLSSATGLKRLTTETVADPGNPGPGQVRVRVEANSLNAHDYLAIVRTFGNDGQVPLADGAGIVEDVGAGVTEFRAGDPVISTFWPGWVAGPPVLPDMRTVPGDGIDGYAQEVVVRSATSFTRAPSGWTHVEAATLPTAGVTAWRALQQGGVKAGDVVLTMGSGGVAVFGLQIAKAMGATVISTSSNQTKLERLHALGADHLINYRETPDWGMKVRDITDGRGADIVIEIGGAETLTQSFEAVSVGGHIAMVGVRAGAVGKVPIARMLGRQIHLQGLCVGSRHHQRDLVKALDAIGIRPVIDSTFTFETLADGFRRLNSGNHFGKIAVTRDGF